MSVFREYPGETIFVLILLAFWAFGEIKKIKHLE